MMAKALVICKEIQSGASKGAPDIGTGYSGFVYVGNLPGAYAAYVITGTGAQLLAIQGHANFLVGVQVTEGADRWAELRATLPAGVRAQINNWRSNNGQGPVPAGTTWLQVIRFAANHFDLAGNFDVFDAG